MKKKLHVTQILRHLIQTAAFVFFPGLFLSTFTALRDVVTALIGGTFRFAALVGQLILLFVMFLLTALWGRIFCSYLCAFGAVQELVSWISKRLFPRLRAIPAKADRLLKYGKYVVLALTVMLVWILQLPVDSSLSPWGVFGMLVSGNLSVMSAAVPTLGFAALIAILIGSFFVERFFCRYLCPLGALFALSSGHRIFAIRRKESSCSGCGLCSRKCAMGIEVHKEESVRSGECIDCMRCTDVCPCTALHSTPQPAVAGTAAALMMCGLVHVGDLAVSQITESGLRPANTVSETVPDSFPDPQGTAETSAPSAESAVLPGESNGRYADGVYTGSGSGLRGTTQVQVTVENGTITEITVLSYADDRQYFTKAQSGVIANILKEQSVDVKTVSGATFSSNSILEAVADALDLDLTNTNAVSGKSGSRPRH
ncbi:MAG: 4Fe-4S binding protein [Lachnospiraceae bacterium]|nr:4Fe-4S binding protein [Lachnospiraceae bacterium]